MEAMVTLAGLGWDPEIRGVLTVVTGFVVLMGSIWLIVATNSGIRLATLMAAAALMGWMVILGSAWWMYGSGWKGAAPSGLMEARLLPNTDEMPSAYELVVASGDPAAIAEFNTLPTAGENPDLSADELTVLQADRQLRNEIITRSELAAVARNVTDAAGLRELGRWRLLATTEAGDAQAQAAADVLAHPDLDFASSADYKLLDAYTMGGKPVLQDDPNRWDRIRLWITNSARITHPTRYTVVQLQGVLDQEVAPGEAPPRPVVDPEEPVISVVMVRDLGWVRLRPALVTVGSLLVFLALCYWLHVRDRELMERRREFETSKA